MLEGAAVAAVELGAVDGVVGGAGPVGASGPEPVRHMTARTMAAISTATATKTSARNARRLDRRPAGGGGRGRSRP
jgi:hypothetical protein